MNRMLLTRQIAFRQVVAIFAFALAAAPAGWAQSYPDKAKAGVFREGFFWLLDIDGNNAFNSPPDGYFPFGGLASDIPLSGNWNGDSRGSKVGLFRSDGSFVLDTNDDGLIDAGDATIRLGSGLGTTTGDVPVVGDWGGTGVTKVGIYRPSTGQWFLDWNSDGVFDAGDQTYSFGGIAGDKPVVGNWNGDSHGDKVGIFRQGFFWLLDYNGDGVFGVGDQTFAYGGVQGDVPVTGDWTGTGVARVGIVRPYTPGGQPFFWILDVNNDHAIDSTNLTFAYGGLAGDVFLAGNWQPFPPATPTPSSLSINGGGSTGSGPPSASQHTTLAFTFHDNLAGAANIREGYVQLMDVNNTAHCQIFWAPPASFSLDDTSGYCAGLTGSVTYPSSDYSAVVVTVSLAINLAPGSHGVLAQNYDWEGLSTPWSLVGGWTVTPQSQAQSIPSQVAIKSVLFDNPTGCSGTGLAGPIPIFNDGGTYDYTITGCGSDYPFTNYNDFWFCTAPVPGLNLSVINQQFSSFGLSITAPGVTPQGPFQISCWYWDGSNFGTLSWYAMIETPVPVITGVQIYDTSGNVLSTFPIGGQAIITLYGSNLGQQFDSYGNTVGSLLLCSAPGVCPGSGLTLQAINSWSDNGQQYGSQINALVSAASSVSGPFYVAVKTSYWTGFALQARAAAVPAAPVPAITVSSGNSLWFFGLDANGAFNVPPATFTQGDIKTTLTAAGGGAGSYTWVITQGSRKVSFASGAALPLISTMVPNVTLYSLSASTNINDVTVTVTWTDGPGQPSARLMLNVDSPETLRLLNVPLNQAVSDCTANHTPGLGGWWVQYQWRQISYFSVVIQGQSINEAFSQTVQYPAPAYPNGDNWGWRANGSAGVAGVSTFVDNYCNAEQDFVPPPTNPQVPQLGNTLVNCAVQTYHSCPRQQII